MSICSVYSSKWKIYISTNKLFRGLLIRLELNPVVGYAVLV